jgi:hypothetical protein
LTGPVAFSIAVNTTHAYTGSDASYRVDGTDFGGKAQFKAPALSRGMEKRQENYKQLKHVPIKLGVESERIGRMRVRAPYALLSTWMYG